MSSVTRSQQCAENHGTPKAPHAFAKVGPDIGPQFTPKIINRLPINGLVGSFRDGERSDGRLTRIQKQPLRSSHALRAGNNGVVRPEQVKLEEYKYLDFTDAVNSVTVIASNPGSAGEHECPTCNRQATASITELVRAAKPSISHIHAELCDRRDAADRGQ